MGICKSLVLDCIVVARRCPCSFLHYDPQATIFLAGRRDAGKTSLLYNIHLGVPWKVKKKKTIGYNYEVVTFTQKKYYEFIDPSGSEMAMRLWPVFWDRVPFHYVVYVIDMTKFLACNSAAERYQHLSKDREQLSRIVNSDKLALAEPCPSDAQADEIEEEKRPINKTHKDALVLRANRLIIYMNFKNPSNETDEIKQLAKAYLIDHLRLDEESSMVKGGIDGKIPLLNYVSTKEELLGRIGVKESDVWKEEGCSCCTCYPRTRGFRGIKFFK